jgi:hypothetical protein
MKFNKFIFGLCACCGLLSCSDFFDQQSEHIIFTEQNHLANATDTIYSVTGILNKLQAIGDRTILLGEVRGDLVDITSDANKDLREIAECNISDDNSYNVPRDYYAVINNCNYFIANVDTAMKNNRNEYLFMREYAAVKAIRAWTYLQMVLNYEKVKFVTEPILSKADAEKDYPEKGLEEYSAEDLVWTRPSVSERYWEDRLVILGHTPTQYYGEKGRMFVTDTWVDIDTGAAAGGSPMLLRLDDMCPFYAEVQP